MSQTGNPIGGDAFRPTGPPATPSPSPSSGADLPAGIPTIHLSPEELAKIEALRERGQGHPRVSERAFREIRERRDAERREDGE